MQTTAGLDWAAGARFADLKTPLRLPTIARIRFFRLVGLRA
jgi:hypothetical protein